MEKLRVRLTFFEEVLGTASSNPEIHSEFIASKAPDAKSREEEVASLGADTVEEKSTTVFPRLEDGTPFVWDYQIRGFFKDTCSALHRVSDSKSAKLKAFKKEIDGLVFIDERKIPFQNYGDIGDCQRPLRASTAQGERTALAHSETVSPGAYIECTITSLKDGLIPTIKEWLDYGKYRGLGQWRNSGKGRFNWEEVRK